MSRARDAANFLRLEGNLVAYHTGCIGSCTPYHRSSVERAWHVTDPKTIRQTYPRYLYFSIKSYSTPCTHAACRCLLLCKTHEHLRLIHLVNRWDRSVTTKHRHHPFILTQIIRRSEMLSMRKITRRQNMVVSHRRRDVAYRTRRPEQRAS